MNTTELITGEKYFYTNCSCGKGVKVTYLENSNGIYTFQFLNGDKFTMTENSVVKKIKQT
ncbi:hypothetical protein FACS1894195_0140 [Bacteroidia bacterium]|nr:hypothetical protein FACS1894195_0140 [Bacteroidia bacterium]